MSSKKTKQTKGVSLDSFGGIDTRFAHRGKGTAVDMCNFRINADGSIEKRCGFRYVHAFSGNIRAVYSEKVKGEQIFLILHGSEVSSFDIESRTSVNIGSISTTHGAAAFFYYDDRIYLIADGIYEIDLDSESVRACSGYIPLVGKDWDTGSRGEMCEPLNLLSSRARISYKVGEVPSVFLHTGKLVKSVDALYVNGALIDPSEYSYDEKYKTVIVNGLKTGDRALVYITYPDDERRSALALGLRTSKGTVTYGTVNDERLIAFGGERYNVLYTTKRPLTGATVSQ